jgi:Domain of unknown function (DUF1905)
MGAQRFEADLERHGAGTVLRVPFDPVAEFGRVRAPMRVRINGFEFRTTLMRYGGDRSRPTGPGLAENALHFRRLKARLG